MNVIPVNVALTIQENINIKSLISDNIPHISLLQFFTSGFNVYEIYKNLPSIKSRKIKTVSKSKKINDYFYYYLEINSEYISVLQGEIKESFKKYITKVKKPKDIFGKINYKLLPEIVNSYSENKYSAHISLAFSTKEITIPNIKEVTINTIDLFKIGDFGMSIPILKPFFYCHRINNESELNIFPDNCGVELDLRDKNDLLILQHDPFKDGENFEDYLKKFNKKSIILNIKSERIEYKVLELLEKFNINDYFFLDSSFPMIYQLNKIKNKKVAMRFSEYETIESVIKVKDMVEWVWIDCFSKFPLDKENYNKIKENGLKICIVSPELQGHHIDRIYEFKKIISENNFQIDAVCCKYYNISLWI